MVWRKMSLFYPQNLNLFIPRSLPRVFFGEYEYQEDLRRRLYEEVKEEPLESAWMEIEDQVSQDQSPENWIPDYLRITQLILAYLLNKTQDILIQNLDPRDLSLEHRIKRALLRVVALPNVDDFMDTKSRMVILYSILRNRIIAHVAKHGRGFQALLDKYQAHSQIRNYFQRFKEDGPLLHINSEILVMLNNRDAIKALESRFGYPVYGSLKHFWETYCLRNPSNQGSVILTPNRRLYLGALTKQKDWTENLARIHEGEINPLAVCAGFVKAGMFDEALAWARRPVSVRPPKIFLRRLCIRAVVEGRFDIYRALVPCIPEAKRPRWERFFRALYKGAREPETLTTQDLEGLRHSKLRRLVFFTLLRDNYQPTRVVHKYISSLHITITITSILGQNNVDLLYARLYIDKRREALRYLQDVTTPQRYTGRLLAMAHLKAPALYQGLLALYRSRPELFEGSPLDRGDPREAAIKYALSHRDLGLLDDLPMPPSTKYIWRTMKSGMTRVLGLMYVNLRPSPAAILKILRAGIARGNLHLTRSMIKASQPALATLRPEEYEALIEEARRHPMAGAKMVEIFLEFSPFAGDLGDYGSGEETQDD